MKHIKVLLQKSESNSSEGQVEIKRSSKSNLIKISYLIKTIRLMIMLSYMSLMFGLLWYIICDFSMVIQKKNVSEDEDDPAIFENFLTHFGLREKST